MSDTPEEVRQLAEIMADPRVRYELENENCIDAAEAVQCVVEALRRYAELIEQRASAVTTAAR